MAIQLGFTFTFESLALSKVKVLCGIENTGKVATKDAVNEAVVLVVEKSGCHLWMSESYGRKEKKDGVRSSKRGLETPKAIALLALHSNAALCVVDCMATTMMMMILQLVLLYTLKRYQIDASIVLQIHFSNK